MASRILFLADTHLPKRAKVLPLEVLAAVAEADVVIHAGDWVDLATLELLEASSRRLIGVWGNNDGLPLRERLPEVARAEIDGVRFAVVHETGAAAGRERRMDEQFGIDATAGGSTPPQVLVFGHSHIPWDTVTPGGMRLLNPGSPTDRRRQPHRSYLSATADAGALRDVELHLLR
ncbi:metallophosphoesterase [Herbiconiux sp.]|uniref:metallophosphoesterase family protein n=1 Tax=Herbiconiux sp. TaxID=1871186 RepID=UPI0025BE41ED|nr:metallophosphoesterase [Herbiconiux sp.]